MASERDFELLDDYIGNRLNGPDKESFEVKLQSDHDLQRELKLQQGIVESLKKTRAAELKTMLNNIPPAAIPGATSSLARWSAVAVAIVIGVGLYFYLKPQESRIEEHAADTVITAPPVNPETESQAVTPEQSEQEAATTTESNSNAVEKAKPAKKQPAAKPSSEVNTPPIDVYDPDSEESSTNNAPQEIVKDENTTGHTSSSDIATEVISNSKTYTFHYQFKDEKLILYGGFDKDLFQILEFITSDNKRTLFLSYKNNFYLLNQGGEKVKPLSPVNDPVLIQKLKEHQSR